VDTDKKLSIYLNGGKGLSKKAYKEMFEDNSEFSEAMIDFRWITDSVY